LKIEPNSYLTRAAKALALSHLKQYREALSETLKALASEPNHPYLVFRHAYALDDLGKYQEALKQYDLAPAISARTGVGELCMAWQRHYFPETW
jgi:tetratricopeptide (TPR) repeat protein